MIENAQDTGSRIGTDRSCTSCGFNLIHQPVVREPSYSLLVATCPECGTVAPLISYPLMSRWVERWKLVLAVVWIATLLGMFLLQCHLIYTHVRDQTGYIALPLASEIGEAYYAWAIENESFNTNQQWTIDQKRYEYLVVDREWLDSEGKQIIVSTDLNSLTFRPYLYIRMIPVFAISFVAGMLWSAIALGANRRRLLVVAFAVMCLALAFIIAHKRSAGQMYYNATWVAGFEILTQYAIVVYTLAFICMAIGIWSGHPIARWIVRTTLPPNLLPPLSILWTRDGLTPPRG
ncbi:MAG: hypothetical protein R3B67_08680 [Phycisphaerales bacterium]